MDHKISLEENCDEPMIKKTCLLKKPLKKIYIWSTVQTRFHFQKLIFSCFVTKIFILQNVRQTGKISAASNLVFNLQKGIFGAQFPGLPLTDSHPHLPPTESHRHNLGTSSVPRMQWDLAPDSVANLVEEENDCTLKDRRSL